MLMDKATSSNIIDLINFDQNRYKLEFVEGKAQNTVAIPKYEYTKNNVDFLIFNMDNIQLERPGITNPKYWKNKNSDYKLLVSLDNKNNYNKKIIKALKSIETYNTRNLGDTYLPIVKTKEDTDTFKFNFNVYDDIINTKILLSYEDEPNVLKEQENITLANLYILLKNCPKINLMCSYTNIKEIRDSKIMYNNFQILALHIIIPNKKSIVEIMHKNTQQKTQLSNYNIKNILINIMYIVIIISLLKYLIF